MPRAEQNRVRNQFLYGIKTNMVPDWLVKHWQARSENAPYV